MPSRTAAAPAPSCLVLDLPPGGEGPPEPVSRSEAHPAPCVNGAAGPGQPPRDLSCMLGDVGYYRARADDFSMRHPGQAPPDYYLAYGEKYAHRFTEQTLAELGPRGRAWVKDVFARLQQAMEEARAESPAAYDALEQDPSAFQRFAYRSHQRAYLDAGLARLSAQELLDIGLTPDVKDLLSPDGVGQAVAVAVPVLAEKAVHLPRAAQAEAEELLRRLRLHHLLER